MKVRRRVRRRNDNSNKVLYIFAAIVVALVVVAIVFRPSSSGPSLPSSQENTQVVGGSVQNGYYKSPSVTFRVPKGASVSGGDNSTTDSFSMILSGGEKAEYQAALLSGAMSPEEIVKQYGKPNTKVAGAPAIVISTSEKSATLIGTLVAYRFELRTEASTTKRAQALAFSLAKKLAPGEG